MYMSSIVLVTIVSKKDCVFEFLEELTDDNLFVKFIFRECWNILKNKNWADCKHKPHFESGVRMGVGAYNLVHKQYELPIIWNQKYILRDLS